MTENLKHKYCAVVIHSADTQVQCLSNSQIDLVAFLAFAPIGVHALIAKDSSGELSSVHVHRTPDNKILFDNIKGTDAGTTMFRQVYDMMISANVFGTPLIEDGRIEVPAKVEGNAYVNQQRTNRHPFNTSKRSLYSENQRPS